MYVITCIYQIIPSLLSVQYGKIATEWSPKSGLCPTLIEWLQGFHTQQTWDVGPASNVWWLVHGTIHVCSTVHFRPSIPYMLRTTTDQNEPPEKTNENCNAGFEKINIKRPPIFFVSIYCIWATYGIQINDITNLNDVRGHNLRTTSKGIITFPDQLRKAYTFLSSLYIDFK